MPPGVRWTRERYVAFLYATLTVVSAAEPAIGAVLPGLMSCDAPSRASRLHDDLVSLGQVAPVPPSAVFRLQGSAAAAYGAAYVIEQSRLDGRAIAAAVAGSLSLGEEGLTYLRPKDAPAGARWKGFIAQLDAFGASTAEREWRAAAASAGVTSAAFAAAFRDEGLMAPPHLPD